MLPLTPDKGRYHVCIQCDEFFDYDYTQCDKVEANYQLDDDYRIVECPNCETPYAITPEAMAVTKAEAYEVSYTIIKNKHTQYVRDNVTESIAKSMLFDQIKELVEVRELMDSDIAHAKTKLNEQIEYVELYYGGKVSDDVTSPHAHLDEEEKEAQKKDRQEQSNKDDKK